MKVLVVSHSYVAVENRKNITALQRHAEVKVALPSFVDDRVLGRIEADSEAADHTYLIGKRYSLPRSQYVLGMGDMGMSTFKPDIIHIEYDPWATIFWQTLVARRRHAPRSRVVCTVKKNTLRMLPPPIQGLKERMARRLLRDVSHVIAINEGVRRIYSGTFGVPDAKLSRMQHLGLDPDTFFASAQRGSDGPLVVGYCGRLDPNKGVEDLVAAFGKALAGRSTAARLRLLGKGSLSEPLRAASLPWLDIHPPVPHAEVATFLRSLDLFVMPSRITPDHEEHDGHALMEAMACGVASIGSTSGIIPELLADGCGLMFPAGDQLALAERIGQLFDDPQLRSTLATRGRDRAATSFSIEGIAKSKVGVYAKVLAS